MSQRYATVINEQADLQRTAFKADNKADIPGRSDRDDEKLGVASSSILNEAFPQRDSKLGGHDPEVVYNEEMAVIAGDDNPDFRNNVLLDFSSANLSALDNLETQLSTDDLIQAGAPNVSTGDMNTPGTRTSRVNLPRRDAGFGSRVIGDVNVNVPSATRDRIGNYFERHKRRDALGLGTSKPVPKDPSVS